MGGGHAGAGGTYIRPLRMSIYYHCIKPIHLYVLYNLNPMHSFLEKHASIHDTYVI